MIVFCLNLRKGLEIHQIFDEIYEFLFCVEISPKNNDLKCNEIRFGRNGNSVHLSIDLYKEKEQWIVCFPTD